MTMLALDTLERPNQSLVATSAPLSTRSLPPRARALLRWSTLPLATVAALVFGILYGPSPVPAGDALHILLYKCGLYSGHHTWSAVDENIIWQLRVPRTLAAALVGASLAVAGSLFQAVLRNPLADPYIIGTSAGAQLGVIIALLLPVQLAVLGFGSLQILAFAGGLITVLFVYALARTAGRTPIVTLLLAGFVVSSFLISGTTFLMLLSSRITQVMMWTMGSLDVSELTQLAATGPFIVIAILLAGLLGRRLDVVLLGEEQAGHLGIRVERLKIITIVLASLLTALAVTLAGVVAFVGLVIPHVSRLIYGPGHRVLIPTSALMGAVFVVIADILARAILTPTQIPLGIVTAVIGAPLFLHLLRRSKRTYGV